MHVPPFLFSCLVTSQRPSNANNKIHGMNLVAWLVNDIACIVNQYSYICDVFFIFDCIEFTCRHFHSY